MTYPEKIRSQLAGYKAKMFPDIPNGEWEIDEKEYPHILQEKHFEKNILEVYREDFFNSNMLPMQEMDKHFHHLDSSQAMCCNLFFPLAKEKKLEIILEKIGFANEMANYDSVKFGKGAYFETKSRKKLHFEIKYAESAFGEIKKPREPFEIFTNAESKGISAFWEYETIMKEYKYVYEELLDIYKELSDKVIVLEYNKELLSEKILPEYKSQMAFLKNYQIMKSLTLVDDNSYVIFIVPKNNENVYEQAKQARKFVKDEYKDKIKTLLWENLYGIAEEQCFTGALKTHFEEFKGKYEMK
jgi:hypothetical protein